MPDNELSLKNLTLFVFTPEAVHAAQDAVKNAKQQFQDVYGEEEGEKKFYEAVAKADHIAIMKRVNTRIYRSGRFTDMPGQHIPAVMQARFDKRLKEVYGEQYDALMRSRTYNDPRVAELLIQDALRTGNWQMLPDMLLDEYRRRSEDPT